MRHELGEKDMDAIEDLFVSSCGRGFSPRNPRAAALRRAAKAGLVTRCRHSFFGETSSGPFFAFTEAGKSAILKRIAKRHGLAEDDAHHLVRTGSMSLANDPARRGRREPRVLEEFQHEAF